MVSDIDKKRAQDLLAVLDFLNQGGNFERGTIFLQRAREDETPAFKTPGHPLNTFVRENKELRRLIEEEIMPALKIWQQDGQDAKSLQTLQEGVTDLAQVKSHDQRKENSFYPLLVKYQLATEEQTSQLWAVDDAAEKRLKQAVFLLKKRPVPDKYKIEAAVEKMRAGFLQNAFVSETVLLPLLAAVVKVKDWYVVKQDELGLGYSFIDLPANWQPTQKDIDTSQLRADEGQELSPAVKEAFNSFLTHLKCPSTRLSKKDILRGDRHYPVGQANTQPALLLPDLSEAVIKMEVGSLSLKEIPAIFNVLPIDLTFVDRYDRVKWFSDTDRIFPRTQSVIGRPVIRCHPPKSIDKVMTILRKFHEGLADSEDFWVTVRGRLIYLKFCAVRDAQDNYLGCLETVQDVTQFQNLKGNKTLENKEKYED